MRGVAKKILCNFVLILQGQHCTSQNPMQCCLRCSRQHSIRKILCNVLLVLLGQHCTGKTLCNVVPEPPNNIVQEKIQTISSEQHLMMFQTTLHKRNPFQYCLNTLWTTLHRSKPYVMLSEILQTTLHQKNPV